MFVQKNSAKAVIMINDHVLMLKKVYANGSEVYTLPGGTQEPAEDLLSALMREVKEEIDAEIEILDLVHVYEHQRPSSKSPDLIKHKIEFAFLCRLTQPYQPHNGPKPDSHQQSVEWIDVEQLGGLTLNPPVLASYLPKMVLSEHPIYLGGMRKE